MFAAIAARYDRANTVLSGGIHNLWRRRTLRRSGVRAGDRVLDCATGTGDLAIRFSKAGASVVGIDFTPEMIELARGKAPNIPFEVGDVTSLRFDDQSFDIASIGFGIRNVADPEKGIAEMARVAKKVVILEFGQPRNPMLRAMYRFYCKHLLPWLGGIVTGNREAYEYLEFSSGIFPSGPEFVELMRKSAPFDNIDYQPLSLGIAWLYVGETSGSDL